MNSEVYFNIGHSCSILRLLPFSKKKSVFKSNFPKQKDYFEKLRCVFHKLLFIRIHIFNFLNKKQSILYTLLFNNYSFHRQQDTVLLLPAALPSSFLLQLSIKNIILSYEFVLIENKLLLTTRYYHFLHAVTLPNYMKSYRNHKGREGNDLQKNIAKCKFSQFCDSDPSDNSKSGLFKED